MVSSLPLEAVSRTDQYKRVMKPLLERKRRARINRCLDELRDLLVAALQAEGETVTRLEKADILEMTVRHVRRLNQRRRLLPQQGGRDPRQDTIKFQQGFVAAAQQVHSFLLTTSTLEPTVSSRLLTHLNTCASAMTGVPVSSPASVVGSAPVAPAPRPSVPQPAIAKPTPIAAASAVRSPRHSPQHQQQQPPLVMPSRSSPPLSPPALIDLSLKPPPLVAPMPRRDVPQDLSLRRISPSPASPEYNHQSPSAQVKPPADSPVYMREDPREGGHDPVYFRHMGHDGRDAWRPW
ncbi:uncharacterized protein LOC143033012 [Oratosquilla oratoria]|uniref:uncharacterized protein LOC143033012 n=1 Tax=Oratosquilla oratoria TaxID=337810 RepID=UPI003F76910B